MLSTFSKKEIPVDSCEIATARKLRKWDYLEKISKELGDNEDISVDLLIGAKCLEALEPAEVIPRQNDGPYANRIALGWCVVDHHQLPLPLRHNNLSLPNNWNMVEKRLIYLKRWFLKDTKFYEDCNKFMEEIISKGYAREANTNSPDGKT